MSKMFPTLILFKLAASYLEPGSSSFLLKLLVSGLVGLVVFFRQIWGFARALWRRLAGMRASPAKSNAPTQPPAQNEIQ